MIDKLDSSSKNARQLQSIRPHDTASWYAVSTRSRQEKVAASLLEDRGVSCFLPLLNVTRQWSDRKQKVEQPLFPGYLFVQIQLQRELTTRIVTAPGVVKFIGNNAGPQPIPEEQIDGVRRVLSQGVECMPCAPLSVGDRVRVTTGVLMGIEGNLLRVGDDSKLILSVEMIQQSIAITIKSSDVQLLDNNFPYLKRSA